MGQSLGHAVQNQRWPTPSRALCLETHQTRPISRVHRPGRARTWPRLPSERTSTARLAFKTNPTAPGAAGRHSLTFAHASTEPPVDAHCSHCRALPPEARGSWCARAAERAWPAHLDSMCDSRSGRRQTPALDVAWALCAANTAREVGPLARDPSSDPRRSQFVAWTTSAGPGCAAWPRYTAKTHGVPWGRPPPLPKRPSPRSSAA